MDFFVTFPRFPRAFLAAALLVVAAGVARSQNVAGPVEAEATVVSVSPPVLQIDWNTTLSNTTQKIYRRAKGGTHGVFRDPRHHGGRLVHDHRA